jgi:hypothetical protein
LQNEPDRTDDPNEDSLADRVYKEEKIQLPLGGVLFNRRPRYKSSMTEGVLVTPSRSDGRNSILRKMKEDESKIVKSVVEEASPSLHGLFDIVAATRVCKRQSSTFLLP